MIDVALKYIHDELASYLDGVLVDDVLLTNAQSLGGKSKDEKGVHITLVNVEQESFSKNAPHAVRIDNQSTYKEPPVQLNLFVLISFTYTNNETALTHLSKTIERFQSKRYYDASNLTPGVPFPPQLNRLVFDMVNLNIEQLNNLWGVLGGNYIPSVLYKIRVVPIQADIVAPAEEITTIVLDSRVQ